MENSSEKRYIDEDEIDLRELFKTIWDKKWFIIIFTSIITIGAIIYVFSKTPVYEAKALVEIGSYKIDNNNNNNNNNILLDNATQLSRKLNVIFIDAFKNEQDRKSVVSFIGIPKKANNFIEIKTESISNKLSIDELKKVVKYIQIKHQKILEDVKKNRELEIKNISMQIKNVKTKEIEFLNTEINIAKNNLIQYQEELIEIQKSIKLIKKVNPVFTALELMEKRNLSAQIRPLKELIIELESKRNILLTTGISKLLERKNKLESMLRPYNYKNSEIVGKIITNDYPIKPKKKLIVVVAFVTGFILSIFVVFFIAFIKGLKEEDKQ